MQVVHWFFNCKKVSVGDLCTCRSHYNFSECYPSLPPNLNPSLALAEGVPAQKMSTDQDETQLYKEWKGFLTADRADLRLAATEAVLQVRDRTGMEKILRHGLVELLAKNASYPELTVAVNALQALVYLSSHGTTANQCVQDLMDAGGLNRMIEIVLSPVATKEKELWKKQINFAMALLANMTRLEAGAVQVAGKTMPYEAVPSDQVTEITTKPSLELILARFVSTQLVDENLDYSSMVENETLDGQAGDPYQHFSSILMNSTQVEAGRRFVMRIHHSKQQNTTTSVFQKLLPFLKSPNPLRRRGIAGMVRNCCLDKDSAWWLIHEVKLVKHLLYPLAGAFDYAVLNFLTEL